MELKDRVFEVSHSLSRKEAELENAERRCCNCRRRCWCLALVLNRFRDLERELNETMRCCIIESE